MLDTILPTAVPLNIYCTRDCQNQWYYCLIIIIKCVHDWISLTLHEFALRFSFSAWFRFIAISSPQSEHYETGNYTLLQFYQWNSHARISDLSHRYGMKVIVVSFFSFVFEVVNQLSFEQWFQLFKFAHWAGWWLGWVVIDEHGLSSEVWRGLMHYVAVLKSQTHSVLSPLGFCIVWLKLKTPAQRKLYSFNIEINTGDWISARL